MNDSLPSAKSAHSPDERRKIQRVIAERGLCGLANDTKWDEFIAGMRNQQDWCPRFRFKCVDGRPSSWDCEWCYHLPFPFISVEWFDIGFLQVRHQLPHRDRVLDHSPWIEEFLRRIGLDYQKGSTMIRTFGYSPKSLELLD